MQQASNPKQGGLAGNWSSNLTMSIGDNNNKAMGKRPGKRPGRKPSKIDERAKLERSRQSARECRARKKLRYQYLEELVSNREKAVFALRDELELYKQWCIQLENGGPVPEALLKMIASEDMATKRRQMAQVSRSLLQQRQQQNLQFSSSSSCSTSPESSSASSQYQQHRQINVVQPQTIVNDVLHKSQIHHAMPDHLSSQHQQQLLLQRLLKQKHAAGAALPPRPFAVDHSKHQERQPDEATPSLRTFLPATQTAPNMATLPSACVLQEQMQPVVFQQDICYQQPQQQNPFVHLNQHQEKNATLHSHSAYSPYFPENSSTVTSKSDELFLPRVHSEPRMKHGHSFDTPEMSTRLRADNNQLPSNSQIQRKRSNSNPVTMASLSHPSMNLTSADDLPSPLQDFITCHSSSNQASSQHSLGFGLFSGSLVSNGPNSTLFNIPTTVTVEDSSSSDDNINEQHLFPSSTTSQKRKVTVPFLPESTKRNFAAASIASTTPTITNFDPNSGLLNLDNLHCFGMTTSSNTPSPSSYGQASSSAPSPTYSPRYSGLSNSTPSSYCSTSPAPLSSLSSILELSVPSPGLATSTHSSALEISPSAQTSQSADSSHYAAPAMSTFLHDWYSFLADLDDGATSSLTPQQCPSSSASTTFNPNQQPQAFAPNQSFMNVPDVINEMLNSQGHLL